MTTEAYKAKRRRYGERRREKTIAWLHAEYPRAFNPAAPKPLGRGLWAEVARRAQQSQDGPTAFELRDYVGGLPYFYTYQKRLACGGYRYGLDGEPVEVVSGSERWHAKQLLLRMEAARVIDEATQAAMDWLTTEYPGAFDEADVKPLAKAAKNELFATRPDEISEDSLRRALILWKSSVAYLCALGAGKARVGLDGAVLDQHAHAKAAQARNKAKQLAEQVMASTAPQETPKEQVVVRYKKSRKHALLQAKSNPTTLFVGSSWGSVTVGLSESRFLRKFIHRS